MATFVASILSICSIMLSIFLQRDALNTSWKRNVQLIWLVVPPLLFITKSIVLTLSVITLLLFVILIFQKNSCIAPIYIAIIAVLPSYVSFELPFPGIRYLLNLNLPVALSILSIPFILTSGKFVRYPNVVDKTILCYVLFISLLNLRDTTFTNGLRLSFESWLIILVPYMAITCLNNESSKYYCIFEALLLLAINFCCIGFFSILKQWNFFEIADPLAEGEIRYGFLRISGPVVPGLFGFICGIGLLLICSGLFFSKALTNLFSKITCAILMILSIYMTISRGTWLACFILFLFYYLCMKRLSNATILVSIFFVFCFLIFVFLFGDALSLDSFGTFEFRQELYQASIQQFFRSPLFGDANYADSEILKELPRGTGGIIDIVSYYLQILLQYGAIGLILFLLPFILLVYQLLRIRNLIFNDIGLRKTVACLIAILLAYLTFIATISNVSLVTHFGWIFIASSQSFILMIKKEVKKQSSNYGAA